jgi:calcium-dependent protein kinase
VFDKIDVDKSNKIGYREFVCAAVDRKELLKDNMLKEAFEFFDKDKNGSISLEEIKKAFSKTQGYNHNDFNEILKQIDLNNDAVIDFAEFKSMMKAILD